MGTRAAQRQVLVEHWQHLRVKLESRASSSSCPLMWVRDRRRLPLTLKRESRWELESLVLFCTTSCGA